MKTFKEILDTNGGEPIELKVTVPGNGDKIIFDDEYIRAMCWTDDDEVMKTPAVFDVDCSWQFDGGVGVYDNQHGELDCYIDKLIAQIVDMFGGKWYYDAADATIVQSR